MRPRGASERPRDELERALDAGLEAIEAALEAAGLELERAFVTVELRGEREPNAASAAHAADGVELDARDVVAWLIGMASAAGEALGLEIKVAPLGRG